MSAPVSRQHASRVRAALRHQVPLDATRTSQLKIVLDVQLRLLSKVLPDLKAVEMSGPDGEPLPAGSGDRMVLATKLLAIMRERPAEVDAGQAERMPSWLQ